LPEPADAEAIALLLADAEVTRYIGNGETGTYDDAVERVTGPCRTCARNA
jgi:hypothetical protein